MWWLRRHRFEAKKALGQMGDLVRLRGAAGGVRALQGAQ